MKAIRVGFEIYNGNPKDLLQYEEIRSFNFRCEARRKF